MPRRPKCAASSAGTWSAPPLKLAEVMPMTAQISIDHQLLLAGFAYDGVVLDLYGDAEGEVLGAALPGQRLDIVPVLRDEVVAAAQRAVDGTARERREHRLDQIQFDRVLERIATTVAARCKCGRATWATCTQGAGLPSASVKAALL
eukprot:gene28105-31747_t